MEKSFKSRDAASTGPPLPRAPPNGSCGRSGCGASGTVSNTLLGGAAAGGAGRTTAAGGGGRTTLGAGEPGGGGVNVGLTTSPEATRSTPECPWQGKSQAYIDPTTARFSCTESCSTTTACCCSPSCPTCCCSS